MSTLPTSYSCPGCKTSHKFPPYVFAHWNDKVTHHCDCERVNTILRGRVAKTRNNTAPRDQ